MGGWGLKFGVDGMNDNGLWIAVLRGGGVPCEHLAAQKMIYRYTWARGNEQSLIDHIAVDNKLRREAEDAKVVRGMFSGSDHFAVIAKVRMREQWRSWVFILGGPRWGQSFTWGGHAPPPIFF